jgi:hypothetical protein
MMTDDKIALRELLEKGSDASFLREMIGFAAQRLMELETDGLCGAGYGERSADRRNQRNGYRDRDWEPPRAASNCASPSCAKAPTSRVSWNPGESPSPSTSCSSKMTSGRFSVADT